MITKEELLKAMKEGKMIYNHCWWFKMKKNGSIYGGCSEPNCCDLIYENFDELFNEYEGEDWYEI
jgi:hypothetical protein